MPDAVALETLVGIDIGGTGIKTGVIQTDGTILAERELPTDPSLGTVDFLDRVAEAIEKLCQETQRSAHTVTHVGVGVPGLIAHNDGRIEVCPNIEALVGARLGSELAKRLGRAAHPLPVENDANLAALGEAWLGALSDADNAAMVTLGTGVGGGLILNGAVYSGSGMAGEVGHITVDPQGEVCGCGSRGCLETLASATAAKRRATAAGLPKEDPGNLELLTSKAASPPEGATPERKLLHAIGVDLGRGLAQLVSLLDLRTFAVGGGFSAALPHLQSGIREGLRSATFGERVESIRVVPAELGPRAGWIGAARHGFLAESTK